jgi:hypothetical protein
MRRSLHLLAMKRACRLRSVAAVLALLSGGNAVAQDFRVEPYLQNPSSDAITIRWLSETSDQGSVSIDGRAAAPR